MMECRTEKSKIIALPCPNCKAIFLTTDFQLKEFRSYELKYEIMLTPTCSKKCAEEMLKKIEDENETKTQ